MAEIRNRNGNGIEEKSTKHEDMLADAIQRTKDDLWRVTPIVALLDGVEKINDEREQEVINAMVKHNYNAIKNSRTSNKFNREFEL